MWFLHLIENQRRVTLSVSRVPQSPDRVEVTFDDDDLVANAGLLLPAPLVGRLGSRVVINTTVRLHHRVGGVLPVARC